MKTMPLTIYRDRYGIPSVRADSLSDAVYGLGYVMGYDSAERIGLLYLTAYGRASEINGEASLEMDTLIHALDFSSYAKSVADNLPAEQQKLLSSFCEGYNRAIKEERYRLPSWIDKITPVDVLTLSVYTNSIFPLAQIMQEINPNVGSNFFVAAPSRTANNAAILSIDPHLPWDGPIPWYEYSIYIKGASFHGATICGCPMPVVGHNENVAWTMTNNSPQLYGLYTICLRDDNPNEYCYHGEWRSIEEKTIQLKYCTGRPGKNLKTKTVKILNTEWGPALPDTRVAIHLPKINPVDTYNQSLAMFKSKDIHQFRDALNTAGFAMWNLAYADINGEIGYHYNAHLMSRSEKYDWYKPVPGDSPDTKWGKRIDVTELPQVNNPKSGLLINGNSAPWLTPVSNEIPVDGWPAYVTSHGSTYRYERLVELLKDKKSLSAQEAMEIATDTKVPYIDSLKSSLVFVVNEANRQDLKEAAALLESWDGRADIESKGTALFWTWMLNTPVSLGFMFDPNGSNWVLNEKAIAIEALASAVNTLKERFGKIDPEWGSYHIAVRGDVTVPVSGCANAVTPNDGQIVKGKIVCTVGSSFRMIVELNPKGIQSWSAMPYGNSFDKESLYYTDQMELFGKSEYKDTLFGLPRIRREASSVLVVERN